MDDLSSLLASLSPDDINMLKAAASQLLGDQSAPEKNVQQPPPPPAKPPDISALLQSLGIASTPPAQENNSGEPAIDPKLIAGIAKIFGQLNSVDDKRIQFIAALKPLLHSERQKKADQAIKMLKLFEVLPLLKEQGLFNLL
ncbi:MAG: hypothetical protein ACLU8W_07485 [Clostridia bacterium]